MEEDLILGEEKTDELDVIDNQLVIINSFEELPDDVYDDFQADKIKVFSNAMKIILAAQRSILKKLK